MTQQIQKTLRDSAAMRWTALLLLAMAMFCSYIFMDILSPIKDLMQDQCLCFLPHLCRNHSRQDGCTLYGCTFRRCHARRSLHQVVCRQ